MKRFLFGRCHFLRWLAVIIACALQSAGINAFALTITAENGTVCPGEGVILHAKGATRNTVTWQKKVGNSWELASDEGAQLKSDVAFIDEMGNADVVYRAVEKEGGVVKVESNEIKITKGTDCVPECHTSVTGEYITGTDFDPTGANTKDLGKDVESYFGDYDLVFGNAACNDWSIRDESHIFNGKKPSNVQDGVSNYYMYVENPNSELVTIKFPANPALHGGITYEYQSYRFVMRAYIKPTCNLDQNAKFITRTGHGTVTKDMMELSVTDDATGSDLGTKVFENFSDARINLSEVFDVGNAPRDNKGYHTLRMDITFYGTFPNHNGLDWFTFKPMFEQFGCTQVAVDYISAEVEKVCLSPKMACKGETVTAIATGFPRNAKYTWEEYVDGKWQVMKVDGWVVSGTGDGYRQVAIKITDVGTKKCRVKVDKGDGNGETIMDFNVYGKECDPVFPSEIVGDATVCVPNSFDYYVDPVADAGSIFYRWTLYKPDGSELEWKEGAVVYDGGGARLGATDEKGAKIRVILPKTSEHGEYRLVAQVVRRRTENGKTVDVLVGDPIVKKIQVHNTPDPSIVLNGVSGSREEDKKLCPADTTTAITAKANISTHDDHKYIYTWTGATAVKDKYSNEAKVSWDHNAACAGTLKNHTIKVKVEIDGIGCPAEAEATYEFEKPVNPSIDCDAFKRTVKKEYELGATEKKMSIDLPVPDFDANCDPNPQMKIEATIKDKEGNVVKKEFTYNKQDKDVNKSVTASAGTIDVKYTVTDGCGKTAECEITLTVVDKTPPNIDCSEIKNYSTKLSKFDGCEAVPGKDPFTLPILKAPELLDGNGVDGKIKGEFKGRVNQTDSPAKPGDNATSISAIWTKDKNKLGLPKDLNDPYEKGNTWILWEFADKSGNTTYCIQKVTVTDDKEPNVTCPNLPKLVLDVDTQTCGLRTATLLDTVRKLGGIPYGYDECSSDHPEEMLVPTLYYRTVGGGDKPITDTLETLFQTGVKYELVWVFKKKSGEFVDETVSVECSVQFEVKDQDPPEFDCSTLQDIIVTTNYIVRSDKMDYDEYASGMGQKGQTAGKVYTLAEYFANGMLSMHDDVRDMCGDVIVNVEIIAPDGKKTIIESLDEFKKFTFKKNPKAEPYRIVYTFTDSNGNVKSCDHNIIVTEVLPPIPDNCPSDTVIYANENCEAVYGLTLDKIPTATVKYYYELRYGDCELAMVGPRAIVPGPKKCEDYKPKTKQGPADIKFEQFKDKSATRSGFKNVVIYPDSVRLYDAEGTMHPFYNLRKATDTVRTKEVTFRTWATGTQCNCAEKVEYESFVANVSNFEKLPNVVNEYKLPVGKNRYVWYYTNAYNDKDPKSVVMVDSCVVAVTVVDSTPPTLVCGDWEGEKEYIAPESCELSQVEVNVKKPTLDDLKATDNCTAKENLKLTWERSYKGNSSGETSNPAVLANPYKVGVTTIKWIVSDESGNKDSCTQIISVIDTLGPPVDCAVTTPPITAYVDATCNADPEAVVSQGLQIPEIDDDPCSPTGGKIKGVGSRSDMLDIFNDPYPRGLTMITWVFTDAAGAKSVCEQRITVLDTMLPKFDCNQIKDVVVELPPDSCYLSTEDAKKHLGSYSANDNCDGVIEGKPMWDDNGVEKQLPAKFHKDTTYHIVWHFIDRSNNDKICDQLLTVNDTTPPDVSEVCAKLKDIEKTLDDACEITGEKLDIELNSVFEDPCDGAIKAVVEAYIKQANGKEARYVDDAIKDAVFPVGKHKLLYIYTDKAGLSDTCEKSVTIKDGTKPKILDCYDGRDTVMANVSEKTGTCGLEYEDLKDLIILPKAYDECDSIANGGIVFIEPEVERSFWNITTNSWDVIASGNNVDWMATPFPVGLTQLIFTFADESGNTESCAKYVNVVDARGPVFDCSKIEPNPYYPVAPEGECSMIIENLRDSLYKNAPYIATRACTDETIVGYLALYNYDAVPENYNFEVGVEYHLYWVFKSDIDGKVKTCDQVVRPNHSSKLDTHCEDAEDVTMKADTMTCEIAGSAVITKSPFAIDPCTADTIWGVPHRSDSLEITDPFPTGDTYIKWTMVSPYNVKDTAKCDQKVTIKGNKAFELDCETLTPTMHALVEDCDPADLKDTLATPYADDPCANPDSSYFKRPGEPIRLNADNKYDAELSFTDPYPLGQTTVRWIFTDFTGSMKDSCDQIVDVRTKKLLEIDCDSLFSDTVKVGVGNNICSVDGQEILDSLLKRGYPVAVHPCFADKKFVGVPSRPNGLSMTAPFIYGPNVIVWTFKDNVTNTLAVDSVECKQIVQIGALTDPPVNCKNRLDITAILDPRDCDITFGELFPGLDVNDQDVVDECTGNTIKAVVTRVSLPNYSSADPGMSIDDILQAPFKVGKDTVFWRYDFGAYDVVCTQVITVKDSTKPDLDCDTIKNEEIVLPETVCEIDKDKLLEKIEQPYAYEYCAKTPIAGVPYLADTTGEKVVLSPLPDKFKVGEPYKIAWVFADTALSVEADTCYKDWTIKGSHKPIFDCEAYKGGIGKDTIEVIAVDTCELPLNSELLPMQTAKDYCTDSLVYGRAEWIHNGKRDTLVMMSGPDTVYRLNSLAVGAYNIEWIFKSKYSVAVDTCPFVLNILTDKVMDIACEDSIKTNPTSDDKCSIDTTFAVPFAINPCTNDTIKVFKVVRSDQQEYKLDGKNTFYTGVTTILWIYKDTTHTLLKNLDTCVTVVRVGDIADDPIKCPESIKDTLPKDKCERQPTELGIDITGPTFNDPCTNAEVPLDSIWRTSKKDLTDNFTIGVDTVMRRYIYHGAPYICEQVVSVIGSKPPMFDCDTVADTIKVKTPNEDCRVVLDSTLLPIPVAKDSCMDTDVYGKGVIVYPDGTEEVIAQKVNGASTYRTGALEVGLYNFKWIFESEYSVGVTVCEKNLNILTDKKIVVDCKVLDVFEPTSEDKCSVDIKLDDVVATNPCTGDIIVPSEITRSDGVPYKGDGTDKFSTGKTTITWKFVDESMTLTDNVAYCEQIVEVADSADNPIVCPKDTLITLPYDVCEFEAEKIKFDDKSLWFNDPCNNTLIKINKVYRTSKKDTSEAFGLGVDTIVRQYIYHGQVIDCKQKVVVRNSAIDSIDCSLLGTTTNGDTIRIELKTSADTVTYEDLLAAGFKFPEIVNRCNNIDTIIMRNTVRIDSLGLTAGYGIGITELEFTFRDNTPGLPDTVKKEVSCKRIIDVVSTKSPDMECPPLDDKKYICYNDVPAAYSDTSEFQQAGGRFVLRGADAGNLIDPSTFTVKETFKDKNGNVSTNVRMCEFTVVREYSVRSVRDQSVEPCVQEFGVKDSVAPIFDSVFIKQIRDSEFQCEPDSSFPMNVFAHDNCWNDTLWLANEYLNNEDTVLSNRNGKIYYGQVSTRSNNPTECDYYNYKMTRTYVAYDNCNNASEPLVYNISVIDTVPPIVDVDDKWSREDSVISNYLKGCVFTAPDVISLLPQGSISDDCIDEVSATVIDSLKDRFGYKITQEPAKGDTIYESQYIKIHIVDACDDTTTVNKWVYVPTRKSVVNVKLDESTLCAPQELATLPDYGGVIMTYKYGELVPQPSFLVFDYYYYPYPETADLAKDWASLIGVNGKFDPKYLIYSDNRFGRDKYGDRIEFYTGDAEKDGQIRDDKLALDLMSKSGSYLIVAMDTMTECSDTTLAFLTIHERPRLKMDKGDWGVCEDDSIHITEDDLYHRFNVCVHDMGEPIKYEGWMVDGLVYSDSCARLYGDTCALRMDSVIAFRENTMSLTYYATNSCGTSTTKNSYRISECVDDVPMSALSLEDALAVVRADTSMLNLTVADVDVTLKVMPRLKADSMILLTDPRDKARVFAGENAELRMVTKYNPAEYQWYRVEGLFDGRFSDKSFDRDGHLRPMYASQQTFDEPDELLATTYADSLDRNVYQLTGLTDTASYYVLALDKVCPAVVTNVVSINVVTEIPTAFTPHGSVGMNDVFMEGYHVIIFNRYGQKMTESDNGWDGTCRGSIVDPGVYFYEITLHNDETYKGSIEVVYFK